MITQKLQTCYMQFFLQKSIEFKSYLIFMQDFVAKVVDYYVKLTKIEKMLKYKQLAFDSQVAH